MKREAEERPTPLDAFGAKTNPWWFEKLFNIFFLTVRLGTLNLGLRLEISLAVESTNCGRQPQGSPLAPASTTPVPTTTATTAAPSTTVQAPWFPKRVNLWCTQIASKRRSTWSFWRWLLILLVRLYCSGWPITSVGLYRMATWRMPS